MASPAQFDPDAFMATQQPAFDPDAFMAERTMPEQPKTWAAKLGLMGSADKPMSVFGTLREMARQGLDALQGAASGAATSAVNAARLADHVSGAPLVRAALNKVGLKAPDPLAPAEALIPSTPESTAGSVGHFGEQAAEFMAGGEVATGFSTGMKLLPRLVAQAAAPTAVAGLQTGGDKSAMGTGAVLGAAGGAISEALNPLMAAIGRKIQASTIRPRLSDIKNGFKWETVDGLKLKGNLADSLDQVQGKLDSLRSERNAMLAPGAANVDLPAAFNAAEVKINQDIAKLKYAGQGAKIKAAFDALRQDIEQAAGSGPVDIRIAENAKEHLGTLGSWAYGRADPDSQVLETVANEVYPEIRQKIEQALGPFGGKVNFLNKKMSNLIPVKNAMLARLPVEERNNLFSLQDLAMLIPAVVTGDARYLTLEAISQGQKSLRLGNWLNRAAQAPRTQIGTVVKATAQEAAQ